MSYCQMISAVPDQLTGSISIFCTARFGVLAERKRIKHSFVVLPDGLVFTFFGAGWLIVFAYLQISWGGDMMRSYLRAVSEKARYACPRCGHSLFGHLDGDADLVRCPECGADVVRDVFDWPHPIPLRYRAFPFWRRRGTGDEVR